jgi:WD40 repeat protein
VGGFFEQLGGQPRGSIGAISTTTDSVTSWAPTLGGLYPSVSALQLGAGTTAGFLFVGGDFTKVGSVAAADLAKVSTTSGTADSAFEPDPGPGTSAQIDALALSTSGSSLYAGGYFQSIGGQARNDLARIDTTGANDGQAAAWDPNPDSEIAAIVVPSSGGTVFVGGDFDTIGGQMRNAVAALSSSSGDATAWNANLPGAEVDSIAIDGSDLLLTGDFQLAGSPPHEDVGLFDATSGAVTGFAPQLSGDPAAGAVSGASVLVGGYSMVFGGVQRDALAELDPFGHVSAFAPTFTGAFGFSISALAVSPDRRTLYVGGFFTTADGQPRASLAAVDTATGALTSWQSGIDTNGAVKALAVSPDGRTLYVGGSFTKLGSDNQPRAKLGAVSTVDGNATAWDPGISGGSGPVVRTIALSPDGSTVYVGGAFTTAGANDVPRSNLAAISSAGIGDATTWAPNPHGGSSPTVYSLAVAPNGTVYAGGMFSTAGSNALARPNLAAIAPGGTGEATTWNPAVATSDASNAPLVQALAVSEDAGTLFVGGRFSQLGGQPRIDLGEVSLATGAATTWNPDPGPYLDGVDAIAASDGAVRVGGDFARMGDDLAQGYAQFTSLPAATKAPAISGSAVDGKKLTCEPGTFSNSPLSYTYSWTRGGRVISGETSTTYRVRGGDSGKKLACVEMATNARGAAGAASAAKTPGPFITAASFTHKRGKHYLKFSVTERAKATLTIERLPAGHKRHRKAAKLGKLLVKAHTGSNEVRLGVKLGHHRLSRGRYEAIITARDSGRRKSNRRTIKFRL